MQQIIGKFHEKQYTCMPLIIWNAASERSFIWIVWYVFFISFHQQNDMQVLIVSMNGIYIYEK